MMSAWETAWNSEEKVKKRERGSKEKGGKEKIN